jgi:hypothetical protein
MLLNAPTHPSGLLLSSQSVMLFMCLTQLKTHFEMGVGRTIACEDTLHGCAPLMAYVGCSQRVGSASSAPSIPREEDAQAGGPHTLALLEKLTVLSMWGTGYWREQRVNASVSISASVFFNAGQRGSSLSIPRKRWFK